MIRSVTEKSVSKTRDFPFYLYIINGNLFIHTYLHKQKQERIFLSKCVYYIGLETILAVTHVYIRFFPIWNFWMQPDKFSLCIIIPVRPSSLHIKSVLPVPYSRFHIPHRCSIRQCATPERHFTHDRKPPALSCSKQFFHRSKPQRNVSELSLKLMYSFNSYTFVIIQHIM